MKAETSVEAIKRRYDDANDTLGYDQAMDILIALGLSEAQADNVLHPTKEK